MAIAAQRVVRAALPPVRIGHLAIGAAMLDLPEIGLSLTLSDLHQGAFEAPSESGP